MYLTQRKRPDGETDRQTDRQSALREQLTDDRARHKSSVVAVSNWCLFIYTCTPMYINTHTDYHSPAGTQYQQHENCIKRCSHQQRVESNQSNDSCRLWQQDEINWPSNKYMQLSTVKRYKSWTQRQHVACRLTCCWCGKCFTRMSGTPTKSTWLSLSLYKFDEIDVVVMRDFVFCDFALKLLYSCPLLGF